MRIKTNADELADMELVALSEINPAELKPATVYGKDDVQKVNDRVVYRLADIYAKQDGRKATVSVRVFTKPAKPIDELTKIRLTGAVLITPYLQGTRIAFSIVADGVEPVA